MKSRFRETPLLLQHIDSLRDQLRNSERKVADVVTRPPEQVVSGRLSDLARSAGVSDPSVVRFCRAVGFDSFSDFKMRLAQDLAPSGDGAFRVSQVELSHGDTIATALPKVFAASLACLVQVRDKLDPAALENAAFAIARARRGEIYGFGASAAVAQDAEHKLFRLVPGVIARADPHTQIMAVATLSAGDVVLLISHTGKSKELIEVAKLAAEVGATTIAVTHSQAPLAKLVDVTIGVDVEENTDIYMPMVSRLAQLVVLDVLTLGVALQLPPAAMQRVQAMKEALRAKRVGGGGGDA